MRCVFTRFVPACALVVCLSSSANAQFSGGEFTRGFRVGANVPYDGAPFSHRYNYEVGPQLFFGGQSASQMAYLEWLDRVDRAERFGYRPPPPLVLPDSHSRPRCRWGFGVVFGR